MTLFAYALAEKYGYEFPLKTGKSIEEEAGQRELLAQGAALNATEQAGRQQERRKRGLFKY